MMKQLLLIVLLVTGFVFCLEGQELDRDEKYRAFVHVYISQKEEPDNSGEEIIHLLQKHQVSMKEYISLLKKDPESERLRTENRIQKLLHDIESEDQSRKTERNQAAREACKIVGIPYSEYLGILHRYRTEIVFQRSLKPYFDDYIKSLK